MGLPVELRQQLLGHLVVRLNLKRPAVALLGLVGLANRVIAAAEKAQQRKRALRHYDKWWVVLVDHISLAVDDDDREFMS